MVPKPLPSVLIIHTGGTLGMDPIASYEPDVDGKERLKGGGTFKGTLGPGLSFCPCSLVFCHYVLLQVDVSPVYGIVLHWQALLLCVFLSLSCIMLPSDRGLCA